VGDLEHQCQRLPAGRRADDADQRDLNPATAARPFLGVRVLSGYTTFATSTPDMRQIAHNHIYLVSTVVTAPVAVTTGSTRWVFEAAPTRRQS
jgi:hypothetical protein